VKLQWILGLEEVGNCDRHLDVYDALCPMGQEASKDDVSVAIFLCWLIVAALVGLARFTFSVL
jgi:hypothetical protein